MARESGEQQTTTLDRLKPRAVTRWLILVVARFPCLLQHSLERRLVPGGERGGHGPDKPCGVARPRRPVDRGELSVGDADREHAAGLRFLRPGRRYETREGDFVVTPGGGGVDCSAPRPGDPRFPQIFASEGSAGGPRP